MLLCAHSNAGFLNETNSRSQTGAHIFLSENDPFLRFNGAVLSIAQIIKFVMASAANPNLLPHSSRHVRWFLTAKPLSTWDGPNPKILSKLITPLLLLLPTIRSFLVGAKWWICNFGGFVAKNPKTSFVTIGMRAPKTGLITILNTILTPTMKRITAPMQASGTRLTHDCVPTSPNHWSSGFPSRVLSQFFIFHFILFFLHLGCCRKGV